MCTLFFFVYPMCDYSEFDPFGKFTYLKFSRALGAKLIHDHKERNDLFTSWRRDLDVEDLGSLNLRFLSIQGHAVLDHVRLSFTWDRDRSASRILRFSGRISGGEAARPGKSASQVSRVATHDATVTLTLWQTRANSRHLAANTSRISAN